MFNDCDWACQFHRVLETMLNAINDWTMERVLAFDAMPLCWRKELECNALQDELHDPVILRLEDTPMVTRLP